MRVGERAMRSRVVSTRDIELFTELTGDRNPLHYDEDTRCIESVRRNHRSGRCYVWFAQCRCSGGSAGSGIGVSSRGLVVQSTG